MKRIFFFLLLLFLLIYIHPIVAMVVAVILALKESYAFYEIIILGIIIDSLYWTIIELPWIQLPIYTVSAIILFFSLSQIKKRLSFHA